MSTENVLGCFVMQLTQFVLSRVNLKVMMFCVSLRYRFETDKFKSL